MTIRIGADIGGTFTDLVLVGADGAVRAAKVLSTPDAYAGAIISGLKSLLAEAGAKPNQVAEIDHATTVATNAILERKGATVGLLTTAGFRDVLEIRRVRMPVLYDLTWEKPPPLVPRERRLEVRERVAADGTVRQRLDPESARAAIARLKDKGVESVAICFLHSYASPEHERAVGELAGEAFEFVSLSSDVLPEMREYERTATAVVDAYVKPMVQSYLRALRRKLDEMSVDAPLLVMQSSGGLISDTVAAARPVRIIESGPAAGVIAAAAAGREIGVQNLITFDMGGTTAKASVIERGEITLAHEHEVGAGISKVSRLIKGAGHLIRIPAIDIAEVGAGGGSLAWIDKGGALRVGPESAGAVPGPACYASGGTAPTVTDANVVLGYLNPEYLVGGALRLDRGAAERALRDHVAKPLGLSLKEAAEGVHRVANAAMQRAIRAVSIERGRDPRDFAMIAFGGSGPVHAAALARELDVAQIIVPPHPGTFSAAGLLASDVEQIYTVSALAVLSRLDVAAAEAKLGALEANARAEFAHEGFTGARLETRRYADLRYRRQVSDLMIALPNRPLRRDDLGALAETFHGEHEATYGYATRDERVEIVAFKLRARGLRADAATLKWSGTSMGQGGERLASFGPEGGEIKTPIALRGDIDEAARAGPVIIEEYDATVVVPPGWTVRRPASGFLMLEAAQ